MFLRCRHRVIWLACASLVIYEDGPAADLFRECPTRPLSNIPRLQSGLTADGDVHFSIGTLWAEATLDETIATKNAHCLS
jgi:hypothetical protein